MRKVVSKKLNYTQPGKVRDSLRGGLKTARVLEVDQRGKGAETYVGA